MATLVPAFGEGLSRGSRRHEQHSRSDPGGESLSPLVPGGERQHELAPRGGSREDTLTANYESGEVRARDPLGHLAQPRAEFGDGSALASFAWRPARTNAPNFCNV